MNKKEFEAIVNDAVAAGADRKDAEAYVRAGFKVDEDADGQEKLAGKSAGSGSAPKKNKKKAK